MHIQLYHFILDFTIKERNDSMGKRNPNGYGCVTKLKGNRSKPWVVKVTIYDEQGKSKQTPIDYAETEEQGNIILANYNNNPWNIDRNKVTLAELYQRWAKIKMPKLGKSNQQSLRAAFNHCSKYYGLKYRKIKSYHMQDCIDNCGCAYSTQWAIKNLFGHLDRFAFEIDLIDKMYSAIITAEPIPETSKEVFTEEQIKQLWKMQGQEWVDTVLIYLYTGFRLTELLGMKCEQVDLKEKLFKGGIKTTNGKNRIVPIHSKIFELVKARVEQGDTYLFSFDGKKISQSKYYEFWGGIMKQLETERTPHEARHTFRSRLDSAGGNKKCIDLLMGHKSKDVGERTYTHKTIRELRDTVELLK